MNQIHAVESAEILAPPDKVFDVLADYEVGHPAILPKPYFEELRVIDGGRGAGTLQELRMNIFGVRRTYHMVVTEPIPGRVLVESDEAAGVTTTFTVDPVGGQSASWVTIETRAKTSPGLRGLVERWINPIIMRRIYREELNILAKYVQEAARSPEYAPGT